MSDRHKYRGKIKYHKEGRWLYGYLVGASARVSEYFYIIEDLSRPGDEDADNPLDMYYRYEVDYETAGQSTGMRDKKNDEIFEDDVLFNDITKEYHLVFFDSSSASFNMRLVKKSVGLPVTTASSTSRVMRADRMSRDFEIIGNTHEPQTLPKEVFDGLNP